MGTNIHIASKYRPHSLKEIKGHEAAKLTVKNWMKNGNLPQVLLLVGTRGTGKTTLARILAEWVNCEHPTEDGPCGECPTCKSIRAEACVDIQELDCASNNKVEHILNLLENVSYLPQEVKKKVIILDEVHNITKQAFDKLLKTLEEPPEHVHFVLCTTELDKIPATIISRCIKLQFSEISFETLSSHLKEVCKKEGCTIDDDAVALVAKLGEGSIRDSLSALQPLLESENKHITREGVAAYHGVLSSEQVASIIMALVDGDSQVLASYLQDIQLHHLPKMVKSILNMLQYVVFIKMGAGNGSFDCKSECNLISDKVDLKKVLSIFSRVAKEYSQPYLIMSNLIMICMDSGNENTPPTKGEDISEITKLRKEIESLKADLASLKEGSLTSSVTASNANMVSEPKAAPVEIASSVPQGDAFAALLAQAESMPEVKEIPKLNSEPVKDEIPMDHGKAMSFEELKQVATSPEKDINTGSEPDFMEDFFSGWL